jgi:hypothetical protein
VVILAKNLIEGVRRAQGEPKALPRAAKKRNKERAVLENEQI